MLRAGQAEGFQVCRQHPVQKERIPRADDDEQQRRKARPLPECSGAGRDRAARQHCREQHDAKAFYRDGSPAQRRGGNALMRFEILLLKVRRIVVNAQFRVFDSRDHYDRRKQRGEHNRFQSDSTPDRSFSLRIF